MDTRVPDLEQCKVAMVSSAAAETQSKCDDESRAQQAALEQLADRINAARSIV